MLKKILLTSVIGIVITVVGAVATPTDLDRKTPSSKAYVDTSVATKQLKIPAAGQPNVDAGEMVMTYTANGDGEIGERGLYSDPSSYNAGADGDKLITASALKDTFTNLPTTDTTKLECANENDGCSLWTIVDQTAYSIVLPAGYTQLEYIESTGTQYIDTGVKLNQNSRVEVGWAYYQSSDMATSGRILGSRYTDGNKDSFTLGTNTGKVASGDTLFFQMGDFSQTGMAVSIGTWMNIVIDKNNFIVNDNHYTSPYTSGAFETPYTLKLFAFEQSVHGGTSTVGASIGRCGYFKVYDNGTLVRNLIPAKNSSNVRGMYDLVSGQFFQNAETTGEDFTAGPVVQ